jgi:hypothetical protein
MLDKIAIVLPVIDAGAERHKRLIRCLASYYEVTEGLSDIHVLHDTNECNIYHPILEQYPEIFSYCIPTGLTLMEKINVHALDIANKYKYIGFIGDDIVFKTPFENQMISYLSKHTHAMAFGNDLIWNGKLPTHPFMTSKTVLAVGFFGCPAVEHNFFDNYWEMVFNALDTKEYMPEIVMEHMHPMVRKENTDYLANVIADKLQLDKLKFSNYISRNLDLDLEKIRIYE